MKERSAKGILPAKIARSWIMSELWTGRISAWAIVITLGLSFEMSAGESDRGLHPSFAGVTVE